MKAAEIREMAISTFESAFRLKTEPQPYQDEP